MKRILLILSIVALVFVSHGESIAAAGVTPSSSMVPKGQPFAVTLTYQFSGIQANVLTSTNGVFYSDCSENRAGTGGLPMTVNLSGGAGTAIETLSIPVSVTERVLQQGRTNFCYNRTFRYASGPTSGFSTVTTRARFTITSESAMPLHIKNVNLYFEDRRPEITIEKGHKGLKVYADISYAGTGLLEGYWEVDGRVISRVFQQLSFGGLLKLATPDIPELPTFDPGTHRVRFVLLRPAQQIPLPVVVYFVDLDRFRAQSVLIKTISPQDRATLANASGRFEWERPANAAVFLIQYGDKLEAKAIFSAYTRDAFYNLPDSVLKTSFKAGERYYWKIIGFDEENSIIGESAVQSFTFAP